MFNIFLSHNAQALKPNKCIFKTMKQPELVSNQVSPIFSPFTQFPEHSFKSFNFKTVFYQNAQTIICCYLLM